MRVAPATRGAKRRLRDDDASRRFAVAAARAAREIDGKRASAADITRASRALFRALELSISQNARVYAEFIALCVSYGGVRGRSTRAFALASATLLAAYRRASAARRRETSAAREGRSMGTEYALKALRAWLGARGGGLRARRDGGDDAGAVATARLASARGGRRERNDDAADVELELERERRARARARATSSSSARRERWEKRAKRTVIGVRRRARWACACKASSRTEIVVFGPSLTASRRSRGINFGMLNALDRIGATFERECATN